MKNADLFKDTFRTYATEIWSMPENDFLKWLNEDAKPKTGHWIMSNDNLYRPICNNCGAHPWKGYIPTVEEAKEVFKYCPNCGARMESEDKE